MLKELDNKEVIISGSVENEESEKDAAEKRERVARPAVMHRCIHNT